MRIGLKSTVTNHGSLEQLATEAREAHQRGLASVWVPNYFGMDALTSLAMVGRQVPEIRLGTSIVPIYTRHPFALAQQALTVQAAVGGRLTLGIGLSHPDVVEGAWGLSYDRPAQTMARYLQDLAAMTAPSAARAGVVPVPDEPTPPRVQGAESLEVVVAALGPRMVRIAGALADGVVLWCMGPVAISAVAASLREAAAGAERKPPQVVAALPVVVTGAPAQVRKVLAERYASVDAQPSYRRALDAEGARSVADISLVGSPDEVGEGLSRLAEAGVTEFTAMIPATGDDRDRTLELLSTAARSRHQGWPDATAQGRPPTDPSTRSR